MDKIKNYEAALSIIEKNSVQCVTGCIFRLHYIIKVILPFFFF